MEKKDIENILSNSPSITPPQHLKEKLQKDLDLLVDTSSIEPVYISSHPQVSPWVSRYAAAALFIIGLFLSMLVLDNLNNGNVAWAEVANQSRFINTVHFYCFEFKNDIMHRSRESWYVNGKVVDILADGYNLDDGNSKIKYDQEGNVLGTNTSGLGGLAAIAGEHDLFKVLTQGVFSFTDKEIGNSLAVDIGEDFLVYRFDGPKNEMNIKELIITVGRFSLMPIQMKVYLDTESDAYDMYVFDYEQKHMPDDVNKILKANVE